MTSLRTRLFRAIALIVLLCVGLTVALGLLLTRRAVDTATLKDLSHQADLIAGGQRIALSPLTHLPELQKYFARQNESYLTGAGAGALPESAQRALAHGKSVDGSATLNGQPSYVHPPHATLSAPTHASLVPKPA